MKNLIFVGLLGMLVFAFKRVQAVRRARYLKEPNPPPQCPVSVKLMLILVLVALASGCANVSTTKMHYADSQSGQSVDLELPKQMTASNFNVTFDAKAGTAVIHADAIKTENLEAIKAQANAAKEAAAAITAAGVKAAMSSIGAPTAP